MATRSYNAGMDHTEHLADNLRALNDAGVVTINELAAAAGVDRVTISNFVRRVQKDLRVSHAKAIANHLEMPLDDLLAGPVRIPSPTA